MFNKRIKEDEKLRKELEGYTIYAPYISKWDVETCELIHGHLIMKYEDQLKFNSKYFLRKMHEKYNFSMPLGTCFEGLNKLEEALSNVKNELINISEDYIDAINKNEIKCWIKLESQISGTGNISFSISDDIYEIKNKVSEVASKVYEEKEINESIPLIIECDMSTILDEELVCNIGVEGVLGDDKVTVLGGLAQQTRAGSYVGSIYCEETNKFIVAAKDAAEEAFSAYDREGYRGFITIDVLVTRNKKTNKLTGYNIDPNARFSAGTMLLKAIHKAEHDTNKKVYGSMFSNLIILSEKSMDNIKKCAGLDMYFGKDSNYVGLYPTLMNNVSDFGEGKSYIQMITIEHTYEDVQSKYKEFKNNIIALNEEYKNKKES